MPKITVHLGLTLELPNQKFGSIRADVTYADIDTDGDVESQIARCREVTLSSDEDAEGALAQLVSNASGLNFEGLGVTAEFEKFRKQITGWAGNVNKRLDSIDGVKQEAKDGKTKSK